MRSLQITQFQPEVRIGDFGGQLVGSFRPAPDLLVHLALILVIEGQCAVDLSQREVGVLEMNLLGAGPVGNLVQDDLDNLYSCAGDPRGSAVVELNNG